MEVEKLPYLPPKRKKEVERDRKLKPIWADSPKQITYKIGVTYEV